VCVCVCVCVRLCSREREREGGGICRWKKNYVGNACTLMMGVIFFEFVCTNAINDNNNNNINKLIYVVY